MESNSSKNVDKKPNETKPIQSEKNNNPKFKNHGRKKRKRDKKPNKAKNDQSEKNNNPKFNNHGRKKRKRDPLVMFHGVQVKEKNVIKLEEWIKKRKTTTDQLYYRYWIVKKTLKKDKKEESELDLFDPEERVTYKFTKNPEEANEWIREYVINKNVVEIGVDTENDMCKPFPKGGHIHPLFPDLIQICNFESALLFQTDEGFTKPPEELVKICCDKNITKILCASSGDYGGIRNYFNFHGIKDLDFEYPSENFNGRKRFNYKLRTIDEKFGFHDIDLNRKGLRKLCQLYLNKDLDKSKSKTCSRWSSDVLNEDQIEYAILDAYIPLLLHKNGDCQKGELNEKKKIDEDRKKEIEEKKKEELEKKKKEEIEKKKKEEENEGESEKVNEGEKMNDDNM